MRILLFTLTFFLSGINPVKAQTDSLSKNRKWYLPDYAKLHFAGEIGFLSFGLGKELFKKKNGEIDVFGGFLPERIGGDNIVTMAIKFHYFPWKKEIFNRKIQLEPLTLGINVYHAFGEDLNKARDKNIYPKGYYWWTIGTRFGPFFGSRITKEFNNHSFLKRLTFYIEIGTNDLYLYSWGANISTVPIYMIWNSSFGLKAVF